jgi:hypothetical protein
MHTFLSFPVPATCSACLILLDLITQNTGHESSLFLLGPACLSSGSTSALKVYCAYPTLSSAQIQYPWVSYKETEVPEWGCVYIFWFHKRFPKKVVALSSQCLAAASNMLHCFSLHLAESAGWISTKQAHNSQMSCHRSMSSEEWNCHFYLMPA